MCCCHVAQFSLQQLPTACASAPSVSAQCHAVVAVIKGDVGAVKVAFAWCNDCILCYCVLYCQCMVHYLCMCYYQSCHCGFMICYAGSWCGIFCCIKAVCAGVASSRLQLVILHVNSCICCCFDAGAAAFDYDAAAHAVAVIAAADAITNAWSSAVAWNDALIVTIQEDDAASLLPSW